EWQKKRICSGIPEGAADLTPNRTLMLEAGLDKLAAVDFKKGCYIGQEVTARTHYRGLVKRRLFPVSAPKGSLSVGASVGLADKIIGQCGSVASDGQTDFALASLRLNAVQQAGQENSAFQLEDGTPLQLAIPGWMHPLPGFDSTDE
ncbi:MAG: YgfZ/GcvT domain-containing protein, partial [Candidatus Puniceispirillaceae bacterium]